MEQGPDQESQQEAAEYSEVVVVTEPVVAGMC